MTFREQCQPILDELCKNAEDFPWEDKKSYANWCAQTYYFVLHSTRLFAAAAAKCPLKDNQLHMQYISHLREEAGHENMALRDIKKLGFKIEDFTELPSTAGLYQTQYYGIEHIHPHSFFGYLIALEGLAVLKGKDFLKRVEDTHGKEASVFLRVHAEEDPGHLEEVFKFAKQIDESVMPHILESLKNSSYFYSSMLSDIALCSSAKHEQKKAA